MGGGTEKRPRSRLPFRPVRGKGPLAVLALLLLPQVLAAQEKGGFHLQDFKGALRFTGTYRKDTTSAGGVDLSYWERRFRENLLLDFLGYYYHPKLLRIRLRADLGLEQSTTGGDYTDLGGNIDNRNLGYRGDLDFLKDHPYPTHLYSLRKESRNRQLFAKPTEAVITESGMDLAARKWWIPSTFHYHHYTYDGTWRDFRDERRDNFHLYGNRSDKGAYYDYSVEYNRVNTLYTSTRYNDLFAFASTRHDLDGGGKSSISNRVFLRDQTGHISNRQWGYDADLRIQYLESLYSIHTFGWDRSERRGGSENENLRLGSSLHHKLYQSLDSHLAGRAERSDFTEGRIDRYGGDVGTAYRKSTFFGSIFGSYQVGYTIQDEEFRDLVVSVLDEGHAVTRGVPIYLDHSGVILSSIVITDQSGLTVYSQAAGDYTLSYVGLQVRIDIPIGSRISDGQTILVDYDYRPYRDRRFETRRRDLGLGFRILDFFSFEAGLSRMEQDLLSGTGEETLDDLRIKRARAEIFRWEHSFSVQYEDRKSRLTPYERLNFQLGGGVDLGRGTRWHHGVGSWWTKYPDSDDMERGRDLFVEFESGSPQATWISLRGTYRETHLRSDDGKGYDLEARFSHKFRKTTIGADFQYIKERFRISSDQEYVKLEIFLERRF